MTERARLQASDLVFVGYGVQAPELQWDDYKGADLRGKTMVVLVGDPPVPDPAKPGELDPAIFGGKAMTYYANAQVSGGRPAERNELKLEAGAQRGVVGQGPTVG